MTKHVSFDGEITSSSREAATGSLSIGESADDAAQRLSQDAIGACDSDGIKDVTDLEDRDVADMRIEALVEDVTHDSVKGTRTAHPTVDSSTAKTCLGGAWAFLDTQNTATIGVVPSASATVRKARAKARGPWYRRHAVAGATGVTLLAGSFGTGRGTNEPLSSHSQYGQAQQQGAGNGQGMPGGDQGGPGGGGPSDQGGPGGQTSGSSSGRQGGPGGQNGQGGPGGGSGRASRITLNGDASSGSSPDSNGDQQLGPGPGNADQRGGSSPSGVLQQQDTSPGTQG